jgi:hypothetical protein
MLSEASKRKIMEVVPPRYHIIFDYMRAPKRKLIDALPTRLHIILDYLLTHGKLPRLQNPQTYSEKIAWRKLYDHDPRFPPLTDKVTAKEIVGSRFGAHIIIPTLRTYSLASELDFGQPPLSEPAYVLKANHGSGLNIFIRNQPKNPERIRSRLERFLRQNYADIFEEWAYSQLDRKISVEPLIDTPEGYIPDYKFHVFEGKTFAIELITDRFRDIRVNFYDREWN